MDCPWCGSGNCGSFVSCRRRQRAAGRQTCADCHQPWDLCALTGCPNDFEDPPDDLPTDAD